jgi:transcriptional regulator of arginine metabolism
VGIALRRYALWVEAAGPLVVVTTPPGYASALAQAIDEGCHPGIAGTVAGNNTVFVAPRDGTPAGALQAEFAAHLSADRVSPRRRRG